MSIQAENQEKLTREEQTSFTRENILKFWTTFMVGMLFFLGPIKVSGNWTIAFDVIVSSIRSAFPNFVSFYCMAIIVIAAAVSVYAYLQEKGIVSSKVDLRYFSTKPIFLIIRILGAIFAVMIYFSSGPAWILSENTGGLVFTTTVASVAVIVPIGAMFIALFVSFGGLEFVGTVMRPIMKPAFKVPGRSALDAVASFVGSYSVGIYVTNKMYLQGRYSVRESVIISTCFSTVSIGFFAVVASTLDLLAYFPIIFISSTVVSAILAFILVRIPPLSNIPDDYVGTPQPEQPLKGYSIFKQATEEGVKQASKAQPVYKELGTGFLDGLKLSMVILPPILSIGALAIILASFTPVFEWLGKPMEPFLHIFALPDVEVIAPATLVGIADMFLPALLVTETAMAAKFFIAVLSLTQIFFFSAVIPMLLEADIPVKLKDIFILFLLRTFISIPIIAGITHILF